MPSKSYSCIKQVNESLSSHLKTCYELNMYSLFRTFDFKLVDVFDDLEWQFYSDA